MKKRSAVWRVTKNILSSHLSRWYALRTIPGIHDVNVIWVEWITSCRDSRKSNRSGGMNIISYQLQQIDCGAKRHSTRLATEPEGRLHHRNILCITYYNTESQHLCHEHTNHCLFRCRGPCCYLVAAQADHLAHHHYISMAEYRKGGTCRYLGRFI